MGHLWQTKTSGDKTSPWFQYSNAVLPVQTVMKPSYLYNSNPYTWKGIFILQFHDDVIKWKNFPRNWPFVWGIQRSPVNSPRKGQWRGALMFSLICAWIKVWVNNREAGDLRRHRAHYGVTVMWSWAHIGYLNRLQTADNRPGGRLNRKDGLTRYGDSHVKDKTS